MKSHSIKVEVPLYFIGFFSAWSRYDRKWLDVLRGIVLRPCLLLVAVVHVLGLHFNESRVQRAFQFCLIPEAEPRDNYIDCTTLITWFRFGKWMGVLGPYGILLPLAIVRLLL